MVKRQQGTEQVCTKMHLEKYSQIPQRNCYLQKEGCYKYKTKEVWTFLKQFGYHWDPQQLTRDPLQECKMTAAKTSILKPSNHTPISIITNHSTIPTNTI